MNINWLGNTATATRTRSSADLDATTAVRIVSTHPAEADRHADGRLFLGELAAHLPGEGSRDRAAARAARSIPGQPEGLAAEHAALATREALDHGQPPEASLREAGVPCSSADGSTNEPSVTAVTTVGRLRAWEGVAFDATDDEKPRPSVGFDATDDEKPRPSVGFDATDDEKPRPSVGFDATDDERPTPTSTLDRSPRSFAIAEVRGLVSRLRA